ncbi:MAG: hypothetical protein ACPHRO_08905 [Nannocystaceae bacterium]
MVMCRRRRRWSRAAAVTLWVLGAVGCTNAFLADPPPFVRGITVPLPPPSFAEATAVTVTIEGETVNGPTDGSFVLLYETVSEDGRFEYPDEAGLFVFEDVTVGLPGNCLQLSEYDGESEQFGEISSMKVQVATDDACADALCSDQDAQGACVCVVAWGVGC